MIVELSGRLVVGAASSELDEKVQSLIGAGHRALLLDCCQVVALDTQGIKALIRGYTSAVKAGGALKLLNLSPYVRDVLKTIRLLTIIESFEDEESALKSFAR